MPPIKLKTQVWRKDDPPLVGDTPPSVPAPDAPARKPYLLLWAGVLACIVAGAWLCGTLWYWQSPGTPICAGLWLLLCLGAIWFSWRRAR